MTATPGYKQGVEGLRLRYCNAETDKGKVGDLFHDWCYNCYFIFDLIIWFRFQAIMIQRQILLAVSTGRNSNPN